MWRDLKPQPSFAPAEPLGPEEFDRAMSRFDPYAGDMLALAVSGGPDSMALAWCAKGWAEKNRRTLRAFIVDHGLRATSAVEARDTQQQLKALGIATEILRWEHPPVISRLHATARKARYRLLANACRRAGIRDLLLAHQKEDQAETILMRFAKGSGIDGLGGMAAASTFEDMRLLRPLLAFPKQRLIATCKSARLPYVDDPSNSADRFARGRLRKILPLLADEGFTIDRLIDLGARAEEAAEALDHYTHALLRVATTCDVYGVVKFNLEQLRSAPRAIADRAVGFCLQSIRREDYPIEQAALKRLTDLLVTDEDMQPRTLHGSLIGKHAAHAWIMRETSSIGSIVTLKPGESAVWDGRWQVSLRETEKETYAIRPLGNPPHETLDRLAPDLRHRLPQGRARSSLPALWQNETLTLIPSFEAASGETSATAQLLTVWPPARDKA